MHSMGGSKYIYTVLQTSVYCYARVGHVHSVCDGDEHSGEISDNSPALTKTLTLPFSQMLLKQNLSKLA